MRIRFHSQMLLFKIKLYNNSYMLISYLRLNIIFTTNIVRPSVRGDSVENRADKTS